MDMKKIGVLLLGIAWLASCSSGSDSYLLEVEGNVKGLKKGRLLLQTVADSALITLDSLQVDGSGVFSLSSQVQGPDIYYLYLDKADNNAINDRLVLFTAPGKIHIETEWDNFEGAAEISGSREHKLFEEYRKTQSRFHVRQLELNRSLAPLSLPDDSAAIDSLTQVSDNLLKRSYLYAINFAINNKAAYLAPYIAVSEIADANPVYLDSIYGVLPDSVARSKYGVKLAELLDKSGD